MQSGKTISESSSIRATRNTTVGNSTTSQDSLVKPTAPTVKVSFDPNYGVTFAWNSTDPNATYTLKYQVNGGSTQTIASTGLDSSCTGAAPPCVTLPIFTRLTSVSGTITAINHVGSSPISNNASLTTPAWNPMVLSNLYNDYGSGYAPAEYALTSDGVVIFHGLIRHPQAATASEWVTVLPPAYRPSSNLIFDATVSPNAVARVDVYTDGSVRDVSGNTTDTAAWLSLSGIAYVASSSEYTVSTIPTLLNGFAPYNPGNTTWPAMPQYYVTNLGRVFWQGLVKPGTTTDHTPIFNLTATTQPLYQEQFPVQNGNAFGESEVYTTGGSGYGTYNGKIASYGGGTSWQAYTTNYYNADSGASFTSLATKNSWVAYGSPWPTPGFYKAPDGMVTLRGLIRNGTTTAGTVLATLPACAVPDGRLIFSGMSAAAFARIDVLTSGDITAQGGSISGSWLDLDGITFMAANPSSAC